MHHAARAGVIVKLAQQRRQIAGGDVSQRHDAGDVLLASTRCGIARHRHRGGFRILRTNDFQDAVIHINPREAIDIEDAEEKLIILLFVEHIVATYGNGAAYAGIDNDRFIQVFTDRIDKFLNIGALKAGGKLFRRGRFEYQRGEYQQRQEKWAGNVGDDQLFIPQI